MEHFDEVNPTGETLRRSRTFQMETLTPPSVTLGQTYVIVPRSWWIRQLELCLNGRQLHFSALQYPLGVGQAFNFQDIPRSATLWFTFWCQSGSNRELWLNTCHVIFFDCPSHFGHSNQFFNRIRAGLSQGLFADAFTCFRPPL